MTEHFDKIGLIGRFGDKKASETLLNVYDYLCERDHQVLVDKETAKTLKLRKVETASREDIGKTCDLAIIVGGDGTLLDAARTLSSCNIPLLGINLGRLGFLVDISTTDTLSELEAILVGDYTVEKRNMLIGRVVRNGKIIAEHAALNDIVLHKWDVARMLEYTANIDDKYLHHQRADGLIISTPTGSTAYSLSSGGPVVHPGLNATLLVPICPHTLSNRPIVVASDSRISVEVVEDEMGQGQVTWDGQIHHRLHGGDTLIVEPTAHRLKLLHPKDYDYFQILRAKLHWSEYPSR